MSKHAFILTLNSIRNTSIVQKIIDGEYPDFHWLTNKKVGVFSQSQLDNFIEEEERHDKKILTTQSSQPLKTMSSGERKKALLNYLLKQNTEVLILVNAFDNLDLIAKSNLNETLEKLASKLFLIQISNRSRDILPLITDCFRVDENLMIRSIEKFELDHTKIEHEKKCPIAIPPPLKKTEVTPETLVEFNAVSVDFSGKSVLHKIDWKIRSNEFWQLIGPNGSGKSTLLQMITGDSHKGYGQELYLFGQKKGSGESVWDIKSNIGYFSPAMVDRFRGYHSVINMVISGLQDSIGLYYKPSEIEIHHALQWLKCIGLEHKKEAYFNTLSLGEKRLLLTVRAMIKHPPLLILDEPTVGLDNDSALLFVRLVNTYAQTSEGTIIYASHQKEPQLNPEKIFELQPTEKGSIGLLHE